MSSTYIGIDLGTSSVKLLLVSEEGRILNSVARNYPIFYPHSGWSEQNPEDWFNAVISGMGELLLGQDKNSVTGIGIGGQMHGLVMLDAADDVIRPAILWNDGRTVKQTEYLNEVVGREKLSRYTANIAFAGFTAPKILWVRENEPQNFARISKIMLPKDYVAYRLSGVHSTDFSDASGMLLLDVKNRCWSSEMLDICGVKREWLPALYESYQPTGTLLASIADELGLRRDVVLCAGAGDNAAAAVGTGTVYAGSCNLSLGTSGTAFIVGDKFSVDPNNALHSFCHANGGYHLMGCILSAASCNEWWMKKVLLSSDFAAEQQGLESVLGNNEVIFLPYLMGERSPHNDVKARGTFIGMRPDTSRGKMTLAVLEGVAFALRDCMEVAASNGIKVSSTRICGGGAKSALWRRIIANVLAIPVQTPWVEEGPSYGGAILAMVACGRYGNVCEAADALIKVREEVCPQAETVAAYDKKYALYRQLYPALKQVFASFADE